MDGWTREGPARVPPGALPLPPPEPVRDHEHRHGHEEEDEADRAPPRGGGEGRDDEGEEEEVREAEPLGLSEGDDRPLQVHVRGETGVFINSYAGPLSRRGRSREVSYREGRIARAFPGSSP